MSEGGFYVSAAGVTLPWVGTWHEAHRLGTYWLGRGYAVMVRHCIRGADWHTFGGAGDREWWKR